MSRQAGQTAQCCHLSLQLRLAAPAVLKPQQTLLWQTLTYHILTEGTTKYLHTKTRTESLLAEQTAFDVAINFYPAVLFSVQEL